MDTKWILTIPPYTHILKDLFFNTKKEATDRAKIENASGAYKGRGVRATQYEEYYPIKSICRNALEGYHR